MSPMDGDGKIVKQCMARSTNKDRTGKDWTQSLIHALLGQIKMHIVDSDVFEGCNQMDHVGVSHDVIRLDTLSR